MFDIVVDEFSEMCVYVFGCYVLFEYGEVFGVFWMKCDDGDVGDVVFVVGVGVGEVVEGVGYISFLECVWCVG